jgi:aspartyl-tRNA(Asn)/glutamyl-tRNA(Gln) amidotransferase subunit A
MSEEIYYADATELAERIRAKAISPVEVMEAHLARIEAANPKINAVVCLADDALDQAREAEAVVMSGGSLGVLHGVPFTIKDCIDTEGLKTTRGSKLFEDYVPSADAPVVKRLKEAGGIFIGHTNMPEFAFWWETGNRVYGRTVNPWDADRTSGGSSGGEAAAIAAGLSPLGIGSDVGGSIRQPAHYCGIVGLKATHGRIPLTGHWPEVLLRFMHVGPMARTVRDIALALSTLSGSDGADPYALPVPMPLFPNFDESLPKLRIGWCAEGPFAPVDTEVQQTVARAASTLGALGCEVEPVSLAAWEEWPGQEISMSLFSAEGTAYLERFYKGQEDELTWYIQKRLSLPAPTLGDYVESVEKIELLRQDMARFFTKYDLLLCPTSPMPAHPHEAAELIINGESVQGRNSLRATVPFDLTGSPAMTVPFGWSQSELPIGVQLVAGHYDEPALLHAASALEVVNPGALRRPPV